MKQLQSTSIQEGGQLAFIIKLVQSEMMTKFTVSPTRNNRSKNWTENSLW
jgi:hypothetical protein